MDIETAKSQINTTIRKNNKINRHFASEQWRIKKHVEPLYQYIQQLLPGLSLPLQIDIILNFDGVIPPCQRCGVVIEMNESKTYLCDSCRKIVSNERRKVTNTQKYGGPAPLSSKEKVTQSKETRQKKYGDSSYNNNQKRKDTCIQRYGHQHHMHTPEIKQKVIDTHNTRYGGIYLNTCLLYTSDAADE